MAEVYAIKNIEDISKVENFLVKNYGENFADIWRVGINLALRASDLLNITMEDSIKAINVGYFLILEQKTSYKTIDKGLPSERKVRTKQRPRMIALNNKAIRILKMRITEHPNDHWLFQTTARNHHGENKGKKMPLSYQAVWSAFVEAGNFINIKMGTHTMRKTRGYMLHKNGYAIEEICKMFNHAHPSITMRYIGLEQDRINESYLSLEL